MWGVSVTAEVMPFHREFTMNIDTGDGFTCIACGHWLWENRTEWGDLYVVRPKRFGHMHGTEKFNYCPNCGAMVLTMDEWAEMFPQDQGKTLFDIERRFYEGDGQWKVVEPTPTS